MRDPFEGVNTEGLAGTITVKVAETNRDLWEPDLVAVLIEQDLHPFARYAAWFPATRGFLADPWAATWAAQREVDRHLRPWIQGDSGRGWPQMEPIRSLVIARRAWYRLLQTWDWTYDARGWVRTTLKRRLGKWGP